MYAGNDFFAPTTIRLDLVPRLAINKSGATDTFNVILNVSHGEASQLWSRLYFASVLIVSVWSSKHNSKRVSDVSSDTNIALIAVNAATSFSPWMFLPN